MIRLGEKIKSLRKQKNISQEVFATYLGVSFQAVSKWENGNTSSGKILVVNSLGNMISLMETTESNLLGGALSLDFVKVGDETWVENVVLRPFVTHCSSNYRQIALYPLKDYTADLYRTHYIHSHCKTTLDDFYKNVCENVPREFWGSEDYTIS